MVTLTTQQEERMYEIIHYVKTLVPGDFPLLEFSMVKVYGTAQMVQEMLDVLWVAVQEKAPLKTISEIVNLFMKKLARHQDWDAG